jgi:PKD repeat protein
MISSSAALADPWPAPTSSADAGPDQTVDFNAEVNFDGSGSTGVGDLEYTWFFRDGTMTTENDPYTTHTYAEEGVYNVGLLVEDENGYFGFDTVKITVKNYFPVANAGSDLTADEDKLINFDGSASSDLNDDIVSYEWDFDDGEKSIDVMYAKSYENAGIYHVTLTVTDNDGAYDIATITVTILNVDPTADGTANGEADDELTVYEDENINFDASQSTDTASDAPNLKYAWDFGDSSKAYGMTASHTYTKLGIYIATLRVTDDNGAYTEDEIEITVLNVVPDSNSGPDQTVYEGDTVFFDALASSDTPSDDPLMDYSWSFPDKGTNPTYSWYDDSINDVELLLTDDDGDSETDVTSVSVLNAPPEASVHTAYIPVEFSLRTAGKKGYDIRLEVLEGSMVTDIIVVTRIPGGPDDQREAMLVNINIAEPALVKVHFTPDDDLVKGNAKGAAPVWVDMTFEDGSITTLFNSFNVNKVDEWVWDIDLGEHLVGNTVHFQGTVYDPGTDDLTVIWDFGDGTTISSFYPYSGTHPVMIEDSVEHIFSKYGELTMTFSAEDDNGGIGADIVIVDSQKDSIYIDNEAPTASASSDKISVFEDEVLEFTGMGFDTSSDMGILMYQWDFGDGNSGSGDHVTHSYENEGVYSVLLIVTDDSGAFGVDFVNVPVGNRPPVAIITHPTLASYEDDTVNFDASNSMDTPRDIPKLSYAWDFGDGSQGYGITTNHVYTMCGVYTVMLTVPDDNGAVSTDSVQITVSNVAPDNVNIAAETEVVEDELIFFTGSASDTPSDEPLLVYEWDFGDGTFGQGTSPTHSYSFPGLYTVQLTVTDDDSSSSIISTYVNVDNVVPVAYAGTESLTIYGPEITLEFEGRGFDIYSDQPFLSYRWDLGGGNIQYTPDVIITLSFSGVYDISFEVYDIHSAKSNLEEIRIDFTLDSDGDTVTDEYELVQGTNPLLWDTDSDNLMDYMEIYDYPTDPLVDDTDSDNLNDWHEITHFGVSDPDEDGLSNPLDWDSDGDLVMDGSDTHPLQYNDVDGSELFWDAIKVRNDIGEGVSVVMYGGSCSSIPTVTEVSAPAPVLGDIGIFVSIESSCTPPFDSQIRIRYDDTALPSGMSESDLIIYWWSPGDTMWKAAEATGVDTTHNIVWGYVTHFSVFAVMDASQADSDDDGLKDLNEMTKDYSDTFSGNYLTYYGLGNPLYIKIDRLQVRIPPADITTSSSTTSGIVDLFELGFVSSDFSTFNMWRITNGHLWIYVYVTIDPIFGIHSADLTFSLKSPINFQYMRIDTKGSTDPFDADTDSDSLEDGDEVNYYLTNPLKPDTDEDGLTDGYEVNTYYTDPKDRDTDNDGYSDGIDLDPLKNIYVYVKILEILQSEDSVDGAGFTNGEFYVKVAVNGVWKQSSVLGKQDPHHTPNLLYYWDVPDNSRDVNVKIELWDDDSTSKDDKMDISRSGSTLDMTYNLKTGMWGGDDSYLDRNGLGHSSGMEDGSIASDQDDCEIWFDIYQSDYDYDRLPFWLEVHELSTSPKVANSDSDSDTMPDWWEVRFGLNRNSAGDANTDTDLDGLSNVKEYDAGTNPRFFELNLEVSIMWDATNDYINKYKTAMKKASDYFYDVTDGLLYFRVVTIKDNSGGSSSADIRVKSGKADETSDYNWPSSPTPGWHNSASHITMPETWYDYAPDHKKYWQTICHELGHYLLNLKDEYEDLNGKKYGYNWLGKSKGPASMMNNQDKCSELSSKSTYDNWSPPSGTGTTEQYHYRGGPCWYTFYNGHGSYAGFNDRLWFDLDRNGVEDTSFKTDYKPYDGPDTRITGAYVKIV